MKIGLIYGHVASNLGDLSINRGVISLLNNAFGEYKLHVVFRDPNEEYFNLALSDFKNDLNEFTYEIIKTTKQNNSLNIIENYISNPNKFLKDTKLDQCDLILSNSGEFLFSYFDDYREDILWRVLPAFASSVANIPFITLPSTIGPFEGILGTELIKNYLKLNDSFAVRDFYSFEKIQLLNQEYNMDLLLDPAFFIKYKKRITNLDVKRLGIIMRLNDFGLRIGGRRSSINMREFKKENFTNTLAFQIAYKSIVEYLDEFKGSEVKLFIQTRYDKDLAYKLYEKLQHDGYNNIKIVEPQTIDEYLYEIEQCSVVLSSRFHGSILSMLAKVPVIGLYFSSHGHKMPGLYKMIKKENYAINANDVDANLITRQVISLEKNKDAFKDIYENINEYKEKTIQWLQNTNKKVSKNKNQHDSINSFIYYLEKVKMENKYNELTKLLSSNINISKKELNSNILREINDREVKLKKLENEIKKYIKNNSEFETKNQKLESSLKDLNKKLDAIQKDIFVIENRINTIEKYINRSFKSKVKNLFLKKSNKQFLKVSAEINNEKLIISLNNNHLKKVIFNDNIVEINSAEEQNVYFTSKENCNFNKVPKNYIQLEGNTNYKVNGYLNFLTKNKITFWVIEYNDTGLVKKNKVLLDENKFELVFKTSPLTNKIVIAFGVQGNAKIINEKNIIKLFSN